MQQYVPKMLSSGKMVTYTMAQKEPHKARDKSGQDEGVANQNKYGVLASIQEDEEMRQEDDMNASEAAQDANKAVTDLTLEKSIQVEEQLINASSTQVENLSGSGNSVDQELVDNVIVKDNPIVVEQNEDETEEVGVSTEVEITKEDHNLVDTDGIQNQAIKHCVEVNGNQGDSMENSRSIDKEEAQDTNNIKGIAKAHDSCSAELVVPVISTDGIGAEEIVDNVVVTHSVEIAVSARKWRNLTSEGVNNNAPRSGGDLQQGINEGTHLAVVTEEQVNSLSITKELSPNKVLHDLVSHNVENIEENRENLVMEEDKEEQINLVNEKVYKQAGVSPKVSQAVSSSKGKKKGQKKMIKNGPTEEQ
ncbi:DEK domain-containing chromatin-associated protein 3-like [Lycium ferocissimum]|uniref:DEK domain-containing chromatin-associated protein 3-like n=1 Tax=Lycium ferocissimum TaxID=112874 RepID=UPI002814B5A7|nr:DEK domain-containing chromatin-associated protein 3-like [Lycium ferocissimum]